MHVLRSYEELGAWAREAEAVALTIGFFDGVHRGHRHLFSALQQAAEPSAAKTLAITFSNSPREFHEPEQRWRFLTTPVEKLLLLGRSGLDATLMLRYDRGIASQSAALFLKGLQHFAPIRTLVVGFDTRLGSDMLQGQAALAELAGRLGLTLEFVEALAADGSPIKSSRIRGQVEAGEMQAATALLGHPYFVLSPVVHGKGKGAERLAMPTANLILPPEKLVPPVGVYAGLAEVEGKFFPAATCVMTPELWQATPLEIGSSGVPSGIAADQSVVETHLIGFDGDLYGSMLTLHFLERLRGWETFTDVGALQEQIAVDIERTIAVCQQHRLGVEYADAPA